jgi:hypothetical protein
MKSERDFPCWVLDVLPWEDTKGEVAGISCVPWIHRSNRDPKIILRRSFGDVDKAKSVVARLFALHSALAPHSTGVSVVVGAEEEGQP